MLITATVICPVATPIGVFPLVTVILVAIVVSAILSVLIGKFY
jgi:hypothetical protein